MWKKPFWKRRGCNNLDFHYFLPEFSTNTNPKRSVIVAFWNFFRLGVDAALKTINSDYLFPFPFTLPLIVFLLLSLILVKYIHRDFVITRFLEAIILNRGFNGFFMYLKVRKNTNSCYGLRCETSTNIKCTTTWEICWLQGRYWPKNSSQLTSSMTLKIKGHHSWRGMLFEN